MEIDIRAYKKDSTIDCIRVADEDPDGREYTASTIFNGGGTVYVTDGDSDMCDNLHIKDLQHAKDLIAGIEKQSN